MSVTTVIMGIILFALATMVLYVWGLRRKVTQQQRLNAMLMNNCARRVVKYLRENHSITAKEISYLIKEVKAREFMSKEVAVVIDGKALQGQVISFMLDKGYIKKQGQRGKEALYVLAEEEGNHECTR